jgi:hypothetical protein
MIWLLATLLARLFLLDTDPGGFDGDGTGDPDESGDGGPPGGGDDEGEEEIRDPKAKLESLKEANARLAKKAKKLEARVAELERGTSNGGQALRSAQLEAAFLRAVMASSDRVNDVETAFDLFQTKGFADLVKVDEDGTVSGADEALVRLLERYPFFVDEAEDEPPERPKPKPATRPVFRDKEAPPLPNRKSMEKRMPALRRGHP